MRTTPFVLIAATLLAFSSGCDQKKLTWEKPSPMDPDVEQACREEGYDPGTTEYENCLNELSECESCDL